MMKKALLLFFCLSLFSCQEKGTLPTEEVQEKVTISNSEILEFLFSTAIPVEGGFSIVEQPENYTTSEIQHRQEGIFYIYKPEPGFTGEDMVKIKRADSNGAEIISETITTLNIEVTE